MLLRATPYATCVCWQCCWYWQVAAIGSLVSYAFVTPIYSETSITPLSFESTRCFAFSKSKTADSFRGREWSVGRDPFILNFCFVWQTLLLLVTNGQCEVAIILPHMFWLFLCWQRQWRGRHVCCAILQNWAKLDLFRWSGNCSHH